VRLRWSEAALKDREEIFDSIERNSPQTAAEVDLRIREQARALRDFPGAGRPGRVRGTRELAIDRTPVIVAYRVREDEVLILRILRGTRSWPKHF